MSELRGAKGARIVLPQVEHSFSGAVFDLGIRFLSVTDHEIRYEVSRSGRIGLDEVVRRGEIREGRDLYAELKRLHSALEFLEFWHTN